MRTLREAEADLLRNRAERWRPAGERGLRARRAWQKLTGAAGRGDMSAIRALWWLMTDPLTDASTADECWSVLHRHRSPSDVFAVAMNPAASTYERAAIRAFCARHDLTPHDPVQRAVFVLLTGQYERYRALDPDGSLLATAYRGATEAARGTLRQAMLDAGGLDGVRLIADRPDRVLAAGEAEYVAGQLAAAGEWGRLWQLVPAMPHAGAVAAARLFDDWRPDAAAGRTYLARLAGIEPETISRLPEAAVTRIGFEARYGERGLSIAADGTEIAVREGDQLRVVALPGGQEIDRRPWPGNGPVLALGDGTTVHASMDGDGRIVRCAVGWPAETLLSTGRRFDDLELHRTVSGFVVSDGEHLHVGGARGPLRQVPRSALPISLPAGWRVGADPISGNLAFHDPRHDGEIVLTDPGLRVLARADLRDPPHHPRWGWSPVFCGPDRVYLESDIYLEMWLRDGTGVARAAVHAQRCLPMALPSRNLVAVRSFHYLTWLDADTLTAVPRPPGCADLINLFESSFSPDGSLVAACRYGGVEVHDLRMHELAGLPLAEALASDSEIVARAARRPLEHAVAAAVEVLAAGLEYRFGGEVALGSSTTVSARGDDVGLGGTALDGTASGGTA